jgi:hypothetical protein
VKQAAAAAADVQGDLAQRPHNNRCPVASGGIGGSVRPNPMHVTASITNSSPKWRSATNPPSTDATPTPRLIAQ